MHMPVFTDPSAGGYAVSRSSGPAAGSRAYFFMCQHWFVYVVRCSDGSLYTGTTNDIDAEIGVLNGGEGSAYVRARLPVFLAYTEEYMNENDAARRASSVKRMSRVHKEHLLAIPSLGEFGEFGLAT